MEPLTDPETIRLLLEQQPAYAAYALAHLEPRLFPRSYWWRAVASDGRERPALPEARRW